MLRKNKMGMAATNPYWDKTGEAAKQKRKYYGTAAAIMFTAFIVAPFTYGLLSGKAKIKIPNELERKLEIQEKYRNQFHSLNRIYLQKSGEKIK